MSALAHTDIFLTRCLLSFGSQSNALLMLTQLRAEEAAKAEAAAKERAAAAAAEAAAAEAAALANIKAEREAEARKAAEAKAKAEEAERAKALAAQKVTLLLAQLVYTQAVGRDEQSMIHQLLECLVCLLKL
jgi:hypothetical protein